MSDLELQEEEREVLQSIYEGDECFKQVAPDIYQYKYGENDNSKSFLLEIRWGPNYPTEKPQINLDTFYNNHIVKSLKDKICKLVACEAEQYLGMSMTYSLFEFVKERFEELMQDQPEETERAPTDDEIINDVSDMQIQSKKVPKKEQLTKAQKRRQWDKSDGKGDKPRGWDWIDVVKHLSQTGKKEDEAPKS